MHPFIATAVTALISSLVAAIVSAVITKVKTIRAKDLEAAEKARAEAEKLKEENAQIREDLNNMILMTSRMCIYDEHFSIDEKLDAYKIYRSKGGNHQTKQHMDELVGCDVDEYLERHSI